MHYSLPKQGSKSSRSLSRCSKDPDSSSRATRSPFFQLVWGFSRHFPPVVKKNQVQLLPPNRTDASSDCATPPKSFPPGDARRRFARARACTSTCSSRPDQVLFRTLRSCASESPHPSGTWKKHIVASWAVVTARLDAAKYRRRSRV